MALLKDTIIALFVFGIIIVGTSTFLTSMSEPYDVEINETYVDTYDTINESFERTEKIQDKIENSTGFWSLGQTLLIDGVWFVIKQITGSVKTVATMTGAMMVDLQMGELVWFTRGITGIIIIVIFMSIIGLLFRRDV